MEKKLTINDLAPYLPYGLNTNNGKLWAICNDNFVKCKLDDGEIVKGKIEDIKPLLLPLSNLTKEITHNGETFVPIVRINEILGIRHQLTRYEVDGEIYYGWNEQGPEDSQGYAFGYYKDGKFGIWWDYPDEDAPFNEFTSLSAIKKLYEWHFDLEGLLDAGLALPIND